MTSRPKPETTVSRKNYKKPILTKYGKLKDLTTGGTGTATEGSTGKKPRP